MITFRFSGKTFRHGTGDQCAFFVSNDHRIYVRRRKVRLLRTHRVLVYIRLFCTNRFRLPFHRAGTDGHVVRLSGKVLGQCTQMIAMTRDCCHYFRWYSFDILFSFSFVFLIEKHDVTDHSGSDFFFFFLAPRRFLLDQ